MGVRFGLLFLLVLGSSCVYAEARILATSHVSVVQIIYAEPITDGPELDAGDERLCSLCEQFASQALYYLSQNKTQTEIIHSLHHACSRLPSFREECVKLVDYYAPLFFMEIGPIHAENFCTKVNLCDNAAIVSGQNSCSICHQAVVEVLMKLKDPDTQLEIIELLLKGCDKVESQWKQCKKLVFEYGPLLLENAEQYLETHDICTAIHACKDSGSVGLADLSVLELPSSEVEVSKQNS